MMTMMIIIIMMIIVVIIIIIIQAMCILKLVMKFSSTPCYFLRLRFLIKSDTQTNKQTNKRKVPCIRRNKRQILHEFKYFLKNVVVLSY